MWQLLSNISKKLLLQGFSNKEAVMGRLNTNNFYFILFYFYFYFG